MGIMALVGAGLLEGREPPPPTPVFERHRLAALEALRAAQDQLRAIADLFEAVPDADEMLSVLEAELGRRIVAASTALDRFRASRGCEGEA
jgi:hypothetical protein